MPLSDAVAGYLGLGGGMSATTLCIDATVVGPIVELRYASHTEAFKQLYALRRALEANAQLLAALQLIADTDHVDAALDPQRAIRAARAAIASATGSAA